MFDSRHIQTFHAVVEAGSYSAAARALGYTQPAVSQQMQALERAVGTPLFTKVGRQMRLTEAGETLSRHASGILDSMRAAQQQLNAYKRLRSGRVRVCAFPSASATLLPEAVAALSAEHPGIRVELEEAEPPESLHRVLRGDCDITLAFSYPGRHEELPDDLTEVPLLDDRMTVLLPFGNALTRRASVQLTDLAEQRWIAGCARCRANFLEVCADQGFTPDIAFTTDDNLVVQSLVAAGVGVALMPGLVWSFLRHPKVAGRRLEPAAHRQVAAYLLAERTRIPATAALLDELRAAAVRGAGRTPDTSASRPHG